MKKLAAAATTACLVTVAKFTANASARAVIGHAVVAAILSII